MRKLGILILEDRELLLDQLKWIFEGQGYSVYDCYNIYAANEKWKENKSQIDVIITDINMDSRGLSLEEKKISRNGKFSGWLWVNNHIIINGFPADKVIILSEYNSHLPDYVSSSKNDNHKANFKIIKENGCLLDKVDPAWAVKKLLDILKRIGR